MHNYDDIDIHGTPFYRHDMMQQDNNTCVLFSPTYVYVGVTVKYQSQPKVEGHQLALDNQRFLSLPDASFAVGPEEISHPKFCRLGTETTGPHALSAMANASQ